MKGHLEIQAMIVKNKWLAEINSSGRSLKWARNWKQKKNVSSKLVTKMWKQNPRTKTTTESDQGEKHKNKVWIYLSCLVTVYSLYLSKAVTAFNTLSFFFRRLLCKDSSK